MWKSNICGSSRACVALPPCRSDSQILFLNEMSFIRFSTQFASFCSSVILFFFLSAIFRPWTVTLWNVAVTQSCQVVLCLTSSRFACLLFMWLCVIVVLRERKRERKKERKRERETSIVVFLISSSLLFYVFHFKFKDFWWSKGQKRP